jgi:hypothetical protein
MAAHLHGTGAEQRPVDPKHFSLFAADWLWRSETGSLAGTIRRNPSNPSHPYLRSSVGRPERPCDRFV